MSIDTDIARYENFLRLDPGNAHLLILLGEAYLRQGRLDDAMQRFDNCLTQMPGDITAQARRAEVLLAQQQHTQAEQALRVLLTHAPEQPALLHNLGLALYGQARWQEAARCFDQARALGLALPRNTLYHAYALHRQGHLGEAMALCRDALAVSADAELDGYLCILELDAGRMTAAHGHALSILERHPDNADAALVCGLWHMEQQEIDLAERHIDAALQLRPNGARAWLARGLLHLYKQEHVQAIAAIETALAGMPDHLGTHATLGWARFAARDWVGAERCFRDLIGIDGSFAESHGGLAASLAAQGRTDEARRAARVARRIDPDNLAALWVRSAMNSSQGQTAVGAPSLEQALRRPLEEKGRSLFDHIQLYGQRQAQRVAASKDEYGTL